VLYSPVHPILDFIVEERKVWSILLCSFLHLSVMFSLFGHTRSIYLTK
jgi:hypothetical protein